MTWVLSNRSLPDRIAASIRVGNRVVFMALVEVVNTILVWVLCSTCVKFFFNSFNGHNNQSTKIVSSSHWFKGYGGHFRGQSTSNRGHPRCLLSGFSTPTDSMESVSIPERAGARKVVYHNNTHRRKREWKEMTIWRHRIYFRCVTIFSRKGRDEKTFRTYFSTL